MRQLKRFSQLTAGLWAVLAMASAAQGCGDTSPDAEQVTQADADGSGANLDGVIGAGDATVDVAALDVAAPDVAALDAGGDAVSPADAKPDVLALDTVGGDGVASDADDGAGAGDGQVTGDAGEDVPLQDASLEVGADDAANDGAADDGVGLDGGATPTGTLCNPCNADSECGAGSLCASYGSAAGSFCATECKGDPDCASGYHCAEATPAAGSKSMVCLKNSANPGDTSLGDCACSAQAAQTGLTTSCVNSNADGSCKGVRSCGPAGLSACSAPMPSAESCDGVDNDCNGQTDDVSCSDGNPCTTDSCDPKAGGCVNTAADSPCDDGNACTSNDACKAGQCAGIADKLCDDANPCTTDACDPASGCTAVPLADAVTCDADGSACTAGDACKGGQCAVGAQLDCDDKDPCTADTCDKLSGMCGHAAFGDGTECSDGSICTTADACKAGTCAGTPIACSDNNPCTADACDPAVGCTSTVSDGEACEDGDLCTVFDVCKGGTCTAGGAKLCGGANPCAVDTCNPLDGTCTEVAKPAGAACDDGSACTSGDVCGAIGCLGKAIDCDDQNACTSDSCDGGVGCTHAPAAAPCDDANACTDFDACDNGKCTGLAKDATVACNDNNPCTADACDPPVGCTHTAVDQACEDGSACTVGDTCKDGKCAAGTNQCACQQDSDCAGLDDGNPCNGTLFCEKANGSSACKTDPKTVVVCPASAVACQANACDPATGKCGLVPSGDGDPCDSDANVCTAGDKCAGGKCLSGVLLGCDDTNPCTDDSCDPKLGCVALPNAATCQDGNACTGPDICSGKVCTPGKLIGCDDGNPCTADNCDATLGKCVSTPTPGACSDGNACTDLDSCKDGVCAPGANKNCSDNNPCTDDTCDSKTGACGATFNSAPCSDGNVCTQNDVCAQGACNPGPTKACDDGNACTTDGCSPQSGLCSFVPNTLACNDGTLCTLGDLCSAGKCGGTPVICDDANVCTDDSCDTKSGKCLHAFNTAPCEDGNKCSVGDACIGGACVAGPSSCPCTKQTEKLICNDNNPCTVDSCVVVGASSSCSHKVSVGAACNSTDACLNQTTCSAAGLCAGALKNCDDNNQCTLDSCDKATGKCVNAALTAGGCSDGDLCTSGDACSAGKCVGSSKTCDDKNPCTSDTCDKASGACSNVNTTSGCNDANPCTTGDTCANGKCTGVAKVCADNNVCTTDSCNFQTGACTFSNNVSPCNDANLCTSGDTCVAGKCVGKPAVSCDDGNPCTNDSCNTATGLCVHVNNGAACNDGNLCTTGDICGGGVCAGKAAVACDDKNPCTDDTCDPKTGKCLFVNNSAACSDGKACTVKDACAAGSCVGTPNTCDDSNPCTTDACVAGTGACLHTNNTLVCDDGNACTQGEVCGQGKCTPKTSTDCGDNNVCTDDKCNPQTGKCVFLYNTAACSDGSACTANDLCSGGKCVAGVSSCKCNKAGDCTDTNPCTTETCTIAQGQTSGTCTYSNNTAACTDGNLCTSGDKCQGGACVGAAVDCNDNNKCTDDICLPKSGCQLVANNAACSDGNACTNGDICSGGKCISTGAVVCDDKNVCTSDSCDSKTGACVFAANALACSDGNPCTNPDTCKAGACAPGAALLCNDNNACTSDTCDLLTGKCAFKALTATSCNDGDACTAGDACAAGKCVGAQAVICADGNVCTTDNCNKASGCVFTNNTVGCSDGNGCTTNDVCAAGVCKAGTAKNCSDNNACTTDSCDPATGNCLYVNNTSACDDKNLCTSKDACSGGKCVGVANTCDDGLACTADSCAPATGACIHLNLTGTPCEDGNLCTLSDLCAAGKCAAGAAKVCSDNQTCTTDTCDPKTGGCSFAPSTGNTCSDGNNCTTGDTCQAGKCTLTKTVPCDDGNICTDDPCTAAAVCTHVNNTATCDDGNSCTIADKCAAGKCVGGIGVVCNDGCACTLDACDPKLGCQGKFTAGACLGVDNKVHTCDQATFKTVCVGCALVP